MAGFRSGELPGTPRRSGGSGRVNHVEKELRECLAKQSQAGVIPGLVVPGCRDNLGSVGYLLKHEPGAFRRGSQGFCWHCGEESPAPGNSHRNQGMAKGIYCLFAQLGLMTASPFSRQLG